MLIDLHTHTRPTSADAFLHPDDLVEQRPLVLDETHTVQVPA